MRKIAEFDLEGKHFVCNGLVEIDEDGELEFSTLELLEGEQLQPFEINTTDWATGQKLTPDIQGMSPLTLLVFACNT